MANVYPVAPGWRGIGESGYIPTMYSGKILENLFAKVFLPEISNTDYEGEIKAKGDSVIIRKDPTITIQKNVADGANLVFQTPYVAPLTMNIDQSYAWAFQTGLVQARQTDVKNFTERWMRVATHQVKIELETDILAYLPAQVAAANAGANSGAESGDIDLGTAGGTAVTISKTDVVEKFADMEQALDEQNIDVEGRFAIIPAWLANRIRISDLKDAAMTGDGQSILRSPNGRLGMLCGFTLYQSNLLPTALDSATDTCTYIPFGNKQGLSFAGQITENDNGKNPFGFGMLWKGLFVCGRKVVRPEALGVMLAKKG